MRILALVLLVPVLAACGGGSENGADPGPVDGNDATVDVAAPDAAPDVAGPDLPPADPGTDPGKDLPAKDVPPPDAGPDLPANTPPTFEAIAPLSLDMGASTTVDLTPLLSDVETARSALALDWSARHVALGLQANQVLYVVAPTTWFGVEEIVLTATDAGGLTASSTLKVTVNEVKAEPPKPPAECGTITFSYPAGTGSHVVLLSGSFNQWAATPETADVMTDPDADGTYTVDRVLSPGVYQYKFIVDGAWKPDPANTNQTPDGFGGINSVLQVAPCPQ